MILLVEVIIADTTSLRSRLFFSYVPAAPFIVCLSIFLILPILLTALDQYLGERGHQCSGTCKHDLEMGFVLALPFPHWYIDYL